MSRWLGPIAGLAAGIGLAALLSHFGLSEGFASFLLLALIVVGVVFLVRLLFARRATPAAQYAGATAREAWSDSVTRRDARVEPMFGRANEPAPAPRMPPGFDREAFLRQARMQFKALQQAWDTGDLSAIEDVTTPEMYAELKRDFTARGVQHPTDVVRLDADLLEVATEGAQHWASVRFSGLIRMFLNQQGEPWSCRPM